MTRMFVLLALVACKPAASATPAGAECDGTISEAAFMAGSWQQPGVEEHWTDGAGGTMLGVGRTVSDGRTIGFEFMRIEARADGLVFIAQPSGGAPVEFRRTACERGLLRFENPAHDFPKSIEYRRTGPHGLTAVTRGGPTDAAIVFEYSSPVAR